MIRIICHSFGKSCPTLCDPMKYTMLGFPVYHLLELAQTHVHWVGDAIQPSRPLSSSYPLVLNPSQHQSLFQWVVSLHQVAKVLELHLQLQSFQWIFIGYIKDWFPLGLTGLISLLSMGFSRQQYWSGFPFPTQGDPPDPGIEPTSPVSLALQAHSLPTKPSGKSEIGSILIWEVR